MARGCFFNASSTHHTYDSQVLSKLLNKRRKQIVWRRYNGYMLCFAEMTMTAEKWFSGKTVMTLLRQFHKFQLSREIIASLYCLLISYKVPITESHLFIFFYLEILATKKILLFISSVIWWGNLPPQALLWFSQTNFPCARIVQPVFQREFKTLIK